jgi:NADH-quinone oxidoreductase subunit G
MTETKAVAAAPPLVTLTIDGIEVGVPKGTLVIRAAEQAGIAIPRFCDHPLLDPVGACRQCLVDVPDAGNGRGFPKPQASCTMEVANGMQIKTQLTSPAAATAQRDILELLLINHPLDCPICDKGGECPLQNQALTNGSGQSRYDGVKRTYPKPIRLSAQLLLDRERCVLCARCTRFADQIAGDPLISLVERGAKGQVGISADQPFDSYFAGNVVQICPVGALTSNAYRFSARPFDLVSTVTTCEGCAAGCQLRVDHRHFEVKRRQAGELPAVNEEWNCDRGRFGFVSTRGEDRITRPLIRRDGVLEPASWPEAIDAAVAGLTKAKGRTGVLTGGRLTQETAYSYARFARTVLGTNDIDCRARALSTEETDFIGRYVAGRTLGESVTYADLARARRVVLVGFEPEDEAPIVFLRLRQAVRRHHVAITVIGPRLSPGSVKLGATLVGTRPGGEAAALLALSLDADTIVLAGERAAGAPGALTAVVTVAATSRARWAWVPRRAGEMGAVDAGAFPTLLPGGRPITDPVARLEVAHHWGVGDVPDTPGRNTLEQLQALSEGTLSAVVVGGLELADLPDPAAAAAALDQADFVLSLEQRHSDVTQKADVVLPVTLLEETSGTFVNWEHRLGPVGQVVGRPRSPMTEIRVLAALADALGQDLGWRTPAEAAASLTALAAWQGRRLGGQSVPPGPVTAPTNTVHLASWRELIDDARLCDGEPALLATARPVAARLSPPTADGLGLSEAGQVTLTGPAGSLELDLVLDPSLIDGVVWVPARARGVNLAALGAAPGDAVTLTAKEVERS